MSDASVFDLVGPFRGPCGVCGGPDARHRMYDAIGGCVIGGDSPASVADDYGLSVGNVVAIARNIRMVEVAARALNRSRSRTERVTRITDEQYRDANAVIEALFGAGGSTTGDKPNQQDHTANTELEKPQNGTDSPTPSSSAPTSPTTQPHK